MEAKAPDLVGGVAVDGFAVADVVGSCGAEAICVSGGGDSGGGEVAADGVGIGDAGAEAGGCGLTAAGLSTCEGRSCAGVEVGGTSSGGGSACFTSGFVCGIGVGPTSFDG
jgi:hypothetical protein